MDYSVKLEVWISKNSEPIVLDLKTQSSTIKLCYQLLCLYNYPPTTEIILKNFQTGREELHLSEIERIDSRFNNKFLISFVPLDIHIDNFYNSLTNGNTSSMTTVTEDTYKSVLNYQFGNLSNYNVHIFRHQLLFLAIRDIVKGQPTLFSKCLASYFKTMDENALFPADIIISVFIEIISTMFADKYEWINVDNETHSATLTNMSSDISEAINFAKFIADLISSDCGMKPIIRASFGVFRPAPLIIDFITLIADELTTRFDTPTTSLIVDIIFGNKWLYFSFTDHQSIDNFLNHKNFYDLFPYLALRNSVYQFIQGTLNQIDIAAVFNAYDSNALWINKKSSKAVFTAMFDAIYEIVESENAPCLVLSKNQHDSIVRLLKKIIGVFKKIFANYICTQLQLLETMVKTLDRFGFEPKGLCFIIVENLIQAKVLSEPLLSNWLQKSPQTSPFHESLEIELNTFILSTIPKPLNPNDELLKK